MAWTVTRIKGDFTGSRILLVLIRRAFGIRPRMPLNPTSTMEIKTQEAYRAPRSRKDTGHRSWHKLRVYPVKQFRPHQTQGTSSPSMHTRNILANRCKEPLSNTIPGILLRVRAHFKSRHTHRNPWPKTYLNKPNRRTMPDHDISHGRMQRRWRCWTRALGLQTCHRTTSLSTQQVLRELLHSPNNSALLHINNSERRLIRLLRSRIKIFRQTM